LCLSPFQPCLRRPPLALRAMAVAAGVVGDARKGAVLASLDMTAERRRAAHLDSAHDAPLRQADMPGIGVAPCLAVAAEDIRHLQNRTQLRRQVRPARPWPCSSVRAGSGSGGWC